MSAKEIHFPDGHCVPAIGQGTWYMGERNSDIAQEVDAPRAGLDLGLTLVDTAEMYGAVGAERVVGQVTPVVAMSGSWCRRSIRKTPADKSHDRL